MWLCFDGLPAGTKFRTFLADDKIMASAAVDRVYKALRIDADRNSNNGWGYTLAFGFEQDLSGQRISGAIDVGEVLFVLPDSDQWITDERMFFIDGSQPQASLGVTRWLPEKERWLRPNPVDMLLRDPHGRFVYWP